MTKRGMLTTKAFLRGKTMKAFKPTKEWIENLAVGDIALDTFGNLRKVVSITYRGINILGKSYVGYYLEFGDSRISEASTEDSIQTTIPLIDKYNRVDGLGNLSGLLIPGYIETTNVMECGK